MTLHRKYRVINHKLYRIASTGQMKPVCKLPVHITTVERALEYVDSVDELEEAVHDFRSED